MQFEDLLEVMDTGSGVWSPLVFLGGVLIAFLVVFIIMKMGHPGVVATGRKGMPFFSGNVPPDQRMKGDQLYWGFTEALHTYYERLRLLHSGDLRDYLFWYLLTTAIITAIFLGVE